MMSSSAASASKQPASKQSASASASASDVKRIGVSGRWGPTPRDYLNKHFYIANDKTIADLKRAISEHIREQHNMPRYELPDLTKMKPYPNLRGNLHTFWVSDDTPIRHLGFDDLEINLPPV
jgi:hypothetical protein